MESVVELDDTEISGFPVSWFLLSLWKSLCGPVAGV